MIFQRFDGELGDRKGIQLVKNLLQLPKRFSIAVAA